MQDTPPTKKIAIIDRNRNWIQWATDVLTADGYQVYPVTSFIEATPMLESQCFDLVLIGVESARQHTEEIAGYSRRGRASVRFLVVSPVVLSYVVLRSLWRSGVSEIHSKPHRRRELLRMVSAELQSVWPSNYEETTNGTLWYKPITSY